MVKHINDQAKELAKQKHRENAKRYYAKNREKVLEHQRAYQAKNRTAINLSRRLKIPIAEIRGLSLAEAIKLRQKI